MALSVRSTKGYLQRAAVLNNAQNYSIRGALRIDGNATPAEYGVNAYLGVQNHLGFERTVFELYENPDDTPDELYANYRTIGGTSTDTPLTTLPNIDGIWLHWCWTHNFGSNASNLYLLKENFNPSSPAYLITPSSIGATENVGWDRFFVWIEKTALDTLSTNMTQTAIIFAQVELTEAQVLAQFAQRAPIAAVTAVDYTYLALTDSANPEVDTGSTATNFTKITTQGSFVDGLTEPSDWSAAPPADTIMFGAEA